MAGYFPDNYFTVEYFTVEYFTVWGEGPSPPVVLSSGSPVLISSHYEQAGLAFLVSDPLVRGGNAIGRLQPDSYSHELRRIGGMYSAGMQLTLPEEDTNEWVQNGIGRHIEIYNPVGEIRWEGFVNRINVKMGEDTFSIGPLVDIANRVSVTYSSIDTSIDPPTLGTRETTDTADNDASTALYGIWHKVRSINGATSADAEQLRDMFLNDPTRAFPAASGDLSLGGGGAFSITLDLLGYWHWFKAYYYSNPGTGDINLSQKIQDVVTADPNGIFSTDFSKITSNTTQVGDSASGGQTAMTILENLNSRGDASDNPYSIGIYANRRLVYESVPIDIEYQKRRGEPVTDTLGGNIRPWDVNPAEWIFRPDFLVGRHPPITADTLGTDPRAGLIEVVKYSSAYGLSVNGVKLSQLDQVLAKRGIGGLA